tara:strand:+ start:629 stop:952 length:324 start_codon:yes stop_codon:yes gene_type:complete
MFSGLSHLAYGILALYHPFYIDEFTRFGFSEFRILIALGQVLGGIGLVINFHKIRLTNISSGLLAIMMAGALITRITIKDDLIQSLPALGYLLINSYIFIKSLKIYK